jgi:uncharacterized NAD(P)/FAD-binding protein YdhS
MEARPAQNPAARFSLAVIGGGFTGTVLAAQFVQHTDSSQSVIVIEKACLPGRGVAYSTQCSAHLLNVPAREMSAFPDDPDHFLRWARSSHDCRTEAGSFVPRKVYGRYSETVLSEAVQSGGPRRLEWKKDEAHAIFRNGEGELEIHLSSGGRIVAEKVVLALGNFPSSNPFPAGSAACDPRHDLSSSYFPSSYFPNPWSGEAFEGAEFLSSVLLVGSGLTSVDVAVELRRKGFRGTVHLLSRHGLLAQWHKKCDPWPVFWNESSPRSVRGLLRIVRVQVRKAQEQGVDWRGVIGSLRSVTQQIWQTLPEEEKQRFLRHVRPYWDAHRHRAPAEIGELIDAQRSSGRLKLHAGRIANYQETGPGARITYRQRQTGKEVHLQVDRVINCTGPETDVRRLHDPLMTALLARGLVRPDRLQLGLDVSADGALIDQEGNVSDSLYAVGPSRKGRLWENTAVPEIREQICQLVEHLVNASPSSHVVLEATRAERNDLTNA